MSKRQLMVVFGDGGTFVTGQATNEELCSAIELLARQLGDDELPSVSAVLKRRLSTYSERDSKAFVASLIAATMVNNKIGFDEVVDDLKDSCETFVSLYNLLIANREETEEEAEQ